MVPTPGRAGSPPRGAVRTARPSGPSRASSASRIATPGSRRGRRRFPGRAGSGRGRPRASPGRTGRGRGARPVASRARPGRPGGPAGEEVGVAGDGVVADDRLGGLRSRGSLAGKRPNGTASPSMLTSRPADRAIVRSGRSVHHPRRVDSRRPSRNRPDAWSTIPGPIPSAADTPRIPSSQIRSARSAQARAGRRARGARPAGSPTGGPPPPTAFENRNAPYRLSQIPAELIRLSWSSQRSPGAPTGSCRPARRGRSSARTRRRNRGRRSAGSDARAPRGSSPSGRSPGFPIRGCRRPNTSGTSTG